MIQLGLRQWILGEFHPGMGFELLALLSDADMKDRLEAAASDGRVNGECLREAGSLNDATSAGNLRDAGELIGGDHVHSRGSALVGALAPSFDHLASTRIAAQPQGSLDDRQRAQKHDQPGALPRAELSEALQGVGERHAGVGLGVMCRTF